MHGVACTIIGALYPTDDGTVPTNSDVLLFARSDVLGDWNTIRQCPVMTGVCC